MKCKNCGANYRTRELKCPYCGTENILGRIWMAEVSDAELDYERERAAANKGLPLYVMNRVVNRILVLIGVVFFLLLVVFGIVDGGPELGRIIYQRTHQKQIQATMEEYFTSGEWMKLHDYMSEYSLYSTSDNDYVYSQASFLAYEHQSFCNYKYDFAEMTNEERQEDGYVIEYILRDGVDIIHLDFGIYDDRQEVIEDSEQYQEWCADVRSFWMGTLGLTSEEVEWLESQDYVYGDDLDSLVSKLKARKAWEQEVTFDEI